MADQQDKLGDVFVEIKVNKDDFVRLLSQGQQDVARVGQQTGQSFVAGISRVLAAPQAIIGSAIGAIFLKAATDAEESIQSIKRLESALQSTGGVAGASSKQIQGWSESLAGISNFDDDAITRATASLIDFTNVRGDNLERTVKLMVDLGAKTGDLQGAARALGTALNDPANGVSLLHRQFRAFSVAVMENAKDLDEHGHRAEAQTMILDELNRVVGGTAQNMQSNWQQAKNSFGELSESIGKQARPVTEAVLQMAAAGAKMAQSFVESGGLSDVLTAVVGRSAMPGTMGSVKADRDEKAAAEARAARGKARHISPEEEEQKKREIDEAAFNERRISGARERGDMLKKIEAETTDGVAGQRKRLEMELGQTGDKLTKLGATPAEIGTAQQQKRDKFETDLAKQRQQSLLQIEAETTDGVAGERARFESQLNQRVEALKKVFDDERVIQQATADMRQKFEVDLRQKQITQGFDIQSRVKEGFEAKLAGHEADRMRLDKQVRDMFQDPEQGDEAAKKVLKQFDTKFENEVNKGRKGFAIDKLLFGEESQINGDKRVGALAGLEKQLEAMREQAKSMFSGTELEQQLGGITKLGQERADMIMRGGSKQASFTSPLEFGRQLVLAGLNAPKTDEYLKQIQGILANEGIVVKNWPGLG